jgi:hypothetical protein
MKVLYQTGKGNHLVPFIVPIDTFAALEKLCDAETRSKCGVAASNQYLFPSTQNSSDHVYGWYAVNKVSLQAGVSNPSLLTATKMRHRISTLYAALDVPENKRQHFMRHMGHSATINETIYQVPQAESEIMHVGRTLREFDRRNMASSTERSNGKNIANNTDSRDMILSRDRGDLVAGIDERNMASNTCRTNMTSCTATCDTEEVKLNGKTSTNRFALISLFINFLYFSLSIVEYQITVL